ncbi:DUF2690 domain-containing protein [Streptomyces huiliensis]|uniref:DUF2690 domain-containing protein n=1 Tax=Streptomyces huiliensis TaxID=2876027 RepID=UPI001CBC0C03|nr:DUF2690 domain-containing protein [Streptomyces huiliensis]MBZ4318783.1 YjfA family protein [Streptomyces huiliensis]
MRIRRKSAVLAAAMLFTGLGGTATAAHAANAGPQAPAMACSTSNAITAKTATVDSIHIELRYSKSSRCAWGRITAADPGDKVWVDRSSNGGSSWDGPLGMTTVQSGSDTHTPAFNDAGYVMRACGWNDSTGNLRCTGWY